MEKKLDVETNIKENGKETPTTSTDCIKETKYCKLLQSVKMEDKENGYTYAFEKLYVKEFERVEIRLCLYKDMRDRSGMLVNKMLVRPVDLTEMEFIKLFELAIKENLFTDEFIKYLKNTVNQK